jgi:CheY-like chemotaxis protein/anti-sigma regulatory factor (Ser/Thr protein kinase)
LNIHAETAYVAADPTRMEQVVTNLLDNALKYTPADGKIDIRLSSTIDEAILTVRDSGIGMSSDLLSRIFDVFVQGERTLDRPQGGLGIGLALVRQLVALHGGVVTADSEGEGQGSVFTIRLPKSMEPDLVLAGPAADYPGATGRILLVEDNEDGRDTMSMMLSSLGHRVVTAADGLSGIQAATVEKPDIAFIDIGLPDMDGYAVARRLRVCPGTCEIKLIALTGYGLEDDRIRALEAGFDMHLVKPVSPDRLIKAISDCLLAPRNSSEGACKAQ